MSLNTRYASIQVSKCMESKRSLRTERIIFDSIEMLNARYPNSIKPTKYSMTSTSPPKIR